MKYLSTWFFLLIISATFFYQLQSENCTNIFSLTPHQAVSQAYQNRSNLQVNVHLKKRARSQSNAIFSLLFPQIAINTRLSKLKPGNLGKHTTDIFIEQLLFSFSGPLQDYFIARKEIDIAYGAELLTRDTIRFETESSLLSLWDSKNKADFISSLHFGTQKRIEKAKNQNIVGFLSTSQWDREQALYAGDIATVFSYPDEYARAEATFQRALEVDCIDSLDALTADVFVARSIDKVDAFTLDFWQSCARTHRKELFILTEQIEQAEYIKKKSWGRYLPSAFMFVTLIEPRSFTTVSFEGPFLVSTGERVSPLIWNVGIRFEWQFDSFSGVFQTCADEHFILAKVMEKKDAEQNIKLEVQIAYHDLQEQGKQLEAQMKRFQESKSVFATAKKQFEVGILSSVDFATAEQDWEQAQYDLKVAEIETAQKYRTLAFNAGYPDNV